MSAGGPYELRLRMDKGSQTLFKADSLEDIARFAAEKSADDILKEDNDGTER